MTTVSIQGHDPQSGSMLRGALSIDAGLMGSDASATTVDETVGYHPDGSSDPFYVAGDEGGTVELASATLALTGESAATGTLSADLCPKSGMFDPADTNDCIRLEARVETELRAEE